MALTDPMGSEIGLRVGAGGTPPLLPSVGRFTERGQDPPGPDGPILPVNDSIADCQIDVFFEMDIGGGQLAYNHDPLRLTSVISGAPPSTTLRRPAGAAPLSLFTQPVGGIEVARIIITEHSLFPPTGKCCITIEGQKVKKCIDVNFDACNQAGGDWGGPGTTCTDGVPCPTVSQWGILAMSLLVFSAGAVAIRRRRLLVRT
jgi:hypothetical protein